MTLIAAYFLYSLYTKQCEFKQLSLSTLLDFHQFYLNSILKSQTAEYAKFTQRTCPANFENVWWRGLISPYKMSSESKWRTVWHIDVQRKVWYQVDILQWNVRHGSKIVWRRTEDSPDIMSGETQTNFAYPVKQRCFVLILW